MAVISDDTFDPLRRYVAVRLQQGVPIVDADWNELDDIRKFELRAFLKWFVGDGIPEGSDGFRVEGTGEANDFIVRAGVSGPPDALRNVGRCLVDGQDVIILADLNFRAQPLHVSHGADADTLAHAWGVQTIADIPTDTTPVVVYLDVWERLITPADDSTLVHPGLGIESCARLRREFVIRVGPGTSAPASGVPRGHSYYALATIARRAGDPTINAADVTDLREKQLLVPPSTLITDLFGTTPANYRRGQGRPVISLREAINALLRDELPGTIERDVAPSETSDDVISRGVLFDQAGGLVTVWGSDRQGGISQVFAARDAHPGMPDSWFGLPQPVTTGGAHDLPHAIGLPGGVLIVYRQAAAAGATEVRMRHGTFAADGTLILTDAVLVGDAGVQCGSPFAVPLNGAALLLWHRSDSNSNKWQFNRAVLGVNGVSFPADPTDLAPATNQRDLHAAADLPNSTWVAFRTTKNDTTKSNIQALEVPSAGAPRNSKTLDSGDDDQDPFVLVANDFVWVLWIGKDHAIWYQRFNRSTNSWELMPVKVEGTDVGTSNLAPAAVTDAEGAIWLFWTSNRRGNQQDLWYARRPKDAAAWGDVRPLTTRSEPDTNATVLRGDAGRLWLFWQRLGARRRILSKQVFTTL
jgi:hypothetical protein